MEICVETLLMLQSYGIYGEFEKTKKISSLRPAHAPEGARH
jgi:hypothetical protein